MLTDVDLNIVLLKRAGETYVFAVEEGRHEEAMCLFGRYAARPDLSFNWHDASLAARQLRILVEEDGCHGK
jgi:hypothetical protein